MNPPHVDVVVVGAGVIGLLTAAELASAGASVAILDRAVVPSPWAASTDRHRVVRTLHPENPSLMPAAARSLDLWADVERRVGIRFLHRVGALTVMAPEKVNEAVVALEAAGARGEVLSPDDLAGRLPHLRFPAGLGAVLEPLAGVVLADVALVALARWLQRRPGVQLCEGRAAVAVEDGLGVRLSDGTVARGNAVVVAAGPLSRPLLPGALADALTLYRQSTLYCRVGSSLEWRSTPAVPAFGTAQGAWMVPPVGGTPLRLSAASACRVVSDVTSNSTPAIWRQHLVRHFSQLIRGFDGRAVVDCKDSYYLGDARGGGPVLARIGEGAWAYAACGGLSFKFAPLVAGVLAARALGNTRPQTGFAALDRPYGCVPFSGCAR